MPTTNNNKHTANFLVSSFLSSKRSLKKIYKLNPTSIAILRYLCDSIDRNCKSGKDFKTRISQSQIAKYCHCTTRTVRTIIKILIKNKLLKYNNKKQIFYIGKVLTAWENISGVKDIGKNFLGDRYRKNFPTSNSSNSSNNRATHKIQSNSGYASVENQSTSFNKDEKAKEKRAIQVSSLLEEYIKNKKD